MTVNNAQPLPPGGAIKAAWIGVQFLWYLGWIAALLNMALLLATATEAFQVQYVQLPVSVTMDQPLAPESGLLPVVGYEGRVRVDATNMRGQTIWLLVPLVLMAGYLFVMHLLREFMQTVRAGTPFVPGNPRRLRMIGYTIGAGGPVYGLISHIYARVHIHQLDIPGATVSAPIDVYPFVIFCGLIVVIIAQVFDYGVRLQTEQDLTV